MIIFCCNCNSDINARLTYGSEIYPYRIDLKDIPFWKCDKCGYSVGCHHKNNDSKKPLGIIPSPRIKKARNEIHKILDPLWKNGKYTRTELYKMISIHIGYNYHTAEIRDIEIAKKVYLFLKFLNKN